ncbi:MAG: RNA polymerase sigma factor [Candidatus Sumerlaeaceae bacterium]
MHRPRRDENRDPSNEQMEERYKRDRELSLRIVRKRLKDFEQAEDAAQEALLKRWELESSTEPGPTETPGSALVRLSRRICTRLAHENVRRDKMRADEGELTPLAWQHADARAEAIDHELHERLRAALPKLPPVQLQVITMFFMDELTEKQIAKRLQLTQGAVSKIKRRALETLQKECGGL